MSTFKDANGMDWLINIKFRHVEEVKKHCKGRDGKPLDLMEVLAKMQLDQLIGDTEQTVNAVFIICCDQILERFNLAAYDEAMKLRYEMFPEMKTEPGLFKASRWFTDQMDGPALMAMTNAFVEALVNFCQSESQKQALKEMVEKSKELERMQGEAMVQEINEAMPKVQSEMKKRIRESFSDAMSGNWQESSASTHSHTASGS